MLMNTRRTRATCGHSSLLGPALLGLAGLGPVDATAGPVRWTCKCEVEKNNSNDKCTCPPFSYDLPRSGTKEFRGYCNGKTGEQQSPLAKFINIKRGKNVTCTINSDFRNSYVSKSCTNWGMAQRNKVTMTIECRQWYNYAN
jgi:hypothetical protein